MGVRVEGCGSYDPHRQPGLLAFAAKRQVQGRPEAPDVSESRHESDHESVEARLGVDPHNRKLPRRRSFTGC